MLAIIRMTRTRSVFMKSVKIEQGSNGFYSLSLKIDMIGKEAFSFMYFCLNATEENAEQSYTIYPHTDLAKLTEK